MKKFLSALFTAVLSSALLISSSLPVFAEDSSETVDVEDIEIDVSSAAECDYWGQSLTLEESAFQATRLTKDSQIIVTFTTSDEVETAGSAYSAELIFQSWDNTTSPIATDGNVWAKIAPTEYDETSATYDYESIAKAYGTNDFSEVHNICIGATDKAKITCTSMKITNVKTQKYVEAEEKAAKGTSPVVIAVAVIAGIAIAVVVIVIIMNKKSSEAFDVSTGEFISKKEVKDSKDN